MKNFERPASRICCAGGSARLGNARVLLLALVGALIAAPVMAQTGLDRDGDGHADHVDNCLEVENPLQIDSDGDGFGNRCDADYDGNGTVTTVDFARFHEAFVAGVGADQDHDGDGLVTTVDFPAFFAQFVAGVPGPGAHQPAFVEEGWIPAPEGPRWVYYTVDEGVATHQGDIRFPLAALRAWQETVENPIPIRVERYDAPSSSHFVMNDSTYDGDRGLLTDGDVPRVAGAEALWWQAGWVFWSNDTTLSFELEGGRPIDTLRFTLRNFSGSAFPHSVEISAGGLTHVEPLALDAGQVLHELVISGPLRPDGSYAGLGLDGDVVQVTFRVGSGGLALGEVAFESGTWPPGDPNEPVPDAAVDRAAAWGPVVPYSLMDGFTADELDLIEQAIDEWQEKSDYTFELDPDTTPRLRFGPVDEGCFATGVGRPSADEIAIMGDVRDIGLEANCFLRRDETGTLVPNHGIVMHEIGHALGFFHEQARRDRPRYVDYFEANVEEDRRPQYEARGDLYGEYNFQSIMHYHDEGFARNLCCTESDVDPAFDSADGLPAGCGYQDEIGVDTDGDGVGDSCWGLAEQRNQIVLKTMVSRTALPEDFQLGQRLSLSKGDVSAANALLHGDFEARSYNSLSVKAIEAFAPDASAHLLGDVDNDGRDDLVAIYDETASAFYRGAVFVAHGEPDGTFGPAEAWHASFCDGGVVCRLGDLDGDGRKDLVSFDAASGYVRVAWAYGGRFTTAKPDLPSVVSTSLARNRADFVLGDIDGNCTDDIIAIAREYVAHQYYTRYWLQPARIRDGVVQATSSQIYLEMFHYDGRFRLEDVDGDAQADLVHWSSAADVTVRFASFYDAYGSFGSPQVYGASCEGTCEMGDMNGDGRVDVVDFDATHAHHLERVRIRQSTGFALSEATAYHELDCRNARGCLLGDVDGDGRDDVVDVLDTTSQTDWSRDRDLGTVWVSLAGEFFSDSLGPVSSGGGSIGSLHECMDVPEFEL